MFIVRFRMDSWNLVNTGANEAESEKYENNLEKNEKLNECSTVIFSFSFCSDVVDRKRKRKRRSEGKT